MSTKKERPVIVGLLKKSRDELSITGSTAWFSLFPGSRREGDDWVPDPTSPPRLLIVSKGQKTWLDAGDLKALEKLISDNREDIDAGYAIAGIQLLDRLESQKKLFEG